MVPGDLDQGEELAVDERATQPANEASPRHARVRVRNRRGEWVPAVPHPVTSGILGWARCGDCGRAFWTTRGYRGHFALVHVLGLD